MTHIESPIPLSEIESVLAWVDTFKLSRVTKKINRDFSDAVLLAEILNVYYPKIIEMHNYPHRNSHSLKLNNWMTLNRKVLKKLKLGLCCNTMEQLANCVPGVIERVLVMVRDKIRRDEEANKSMKEEGANVSSGGSYYETCGDEDHVLVVPVKTRVNGVLETVQQKVVNYEVYSALKMELKDAIDAGDVLKQKVEHLDNMIKIKDERIDELQSQLERKQARRKEVEAQQNTLSVSYDTIATSPHISLESCLMPAVRTSSLKTVASKIRFDESRTRLDETKIKIEESKPNVVDSKSSSHTLSKPSLTDVYDVAESTIDNRNANRELDNKKSEIIKRELVEEQFDNNPDYEEFKDSEQECLMIIEETVQNEIIDLIRSNEFVQDFNIKAME